MTFREGMFGDRLRLDVAPTADYETRKSPRIPAEWSVELAELVGYAMADGHIARSNYNGKPAKLVLAFGWDEDALEQRMAQHIVKLFGKEPTFRINPHLPGSGSVRRRHRGLHRADRRGRVLGYSEGPAVLVPGLPKESWPRFLRGYFEGDGSADPLSVRSVSRGMLEDVHSLLTLFGIPSKIREGKCRSSGLCTATYARRSRRPVYSGQFLRSIGFLTAEEDRATRRDRRVRPKAEKYRRAVHASSFHGHFGSQGIHLRSCPVRWQDAYHAVYTSSPTSSRWAHGTITLRRAEEISTRDSTPCADSPQRT